MRGVLSGLLIALASVVAVPRVASACSCALIPNGCQKLTDADAILDATVASIDVESVEYRSGVFRARRIVHLRDVRSLHGETANVIVTGMGAGDCGYPFQVGVRYFVVAGRAQDGRFSTGTCGFTRPAAEAGGLIAYMQSLTRTESGGQIWGRVTKPRSWGDRSPWTGLPVRGARVDIAGPIDVSAVTGADGGYHVVSLPPGDYTATVSFAGQPELRARVTTTRLSLEGARACEVVDFTSQFVNRVSGAIVDAQGRPLAGVFVELLAAGAGRQAGGMGTDSDARGRFSFTGMPAGRYLAGVAVNGPSGLAPFATTYAHTRAGAIEIDVNEASQETLLPMAVTELRLVEVPLTVTLSDGTRAAGAEIRALSFSERGLERGDHWKADVDGRRLLKLYATARYRLRVTHPNGEPQEVDVEASARPLAVTLRLR